MASTEAEAQLFPQVRQKFLRLFGVFGKLSTYALGNVFERWQKRELQQHGARNGAGIMPGNIQQTIKTC